MFCLLARTLPACLTVPQAPGTTLLPPPASSLHTAPPCTAASANEEPAGAVPPRHGAPTRAARKPLPEAAALLASRREAPPACGVLLTSDARRQRVAHRAPFGKLQADELRQLGRVLPPRPGARLFSPKADLTSQRPVLPAWTSGSHRPHATPGLH